MIAPVGVAGAGAGGGAMAGLGAFFTNPWTIGIGAAIIGGLALWKIFGGSEGKKLKKAASSIYGVTLDDGIVKQLKQIKKAFGFKSAEETVTSEIGRDLIEQFAAAKGQTLKGSGKPTAEQLGSESFAGNQFGLAFGGFDSAAASAMAVSSRRGDSTKELLTAAIAVIAQTSEELAAFREKFSAANPADILIANREAVGAAMQKESQRPSFSLGFEKSQGVYI